MSVLNPMALLKRLLGNGRSRSSVSASPARERSLDPFREAFEPYRSSRLEISTPGGTIDGIVVEAAARCLIVREPGGSLVLVPYSNVLSFKPKPLP